MSSADFYKLSSDEYKKNDLCMTVTEALALMVSWRDEAKKLNSNEEFRFFSFVMEHIAGTRSQNFQDLWVAYETSNLRSGYFVEFGAADGLQCSNSFYLENTLLWKGIVCEPAKSYYPEIQKNRNCAIDARCVWSASGEQVMFNETPIKVLSTIDRFSASDHHEALRKDGNRYPVSTVSLNDLLQEHNAPRRIEYISVDTEGSEYDILSGFDFSRCDVRLMTVEHNYTSTRGKIFDLLVSKGFKRKFEQLSRWDDWYFRDYS